MNRDGASDNVEPCSYEILDAEAARTSALILQVQRKCAELGDRVAFELFEWAERCSSEGRRTEAEFLYLNVIHLWETRFTPTYPFHFISLRHYALTLLERYNPGVAQSQPLKMESGQAGSFRRRAA